MYYANKNLVTLNRIFDQNKREGYLRLDLNENPAGLPQDFRGFGSLCDKGLA